MSTERFYTDLPIYSFKAAELFNNPERFIDVPEDWYVLCTDVESSTSFYLEGRWSVVNKLAAAGIDVVLRASIDKGLEIPYVYGGDGILACFPPVMLKEITYELAQLYRYGHAVCGANLRIGIVPVKDVRRAGYQFRVSRVGSTGTISHSLFDDSAFAWIDSVIKSETTYSLTAMLYDVDLSRLKYDQYILPVWQKIEKVYEGEEYLAMIIVPREGSTNRLELYQSITNHIYSCTPRFFDEHPIVELEKDDIFTLDFFKTDGSLKIIVSGRKPNLNSIIEYLARLENEGQIYFGHTTSKYSVITYVIKESNDYMAGLLDLEDGGYVVAAQNMKAKKNPQ
jgi:hypothetical protein